MSVDVARRGSDPMKLPTRDTRPSVPESPTQRAALPSVSDPPRSSSVDAELLDGVSTLNIPGSEQFGKVMSDIQAKRMEQLRKLQEQLRAERERQGSGGDVHINLQDLRELIPEEEEEEEDGDSIDDVTQEELLTPLQMTARRAWGRVRRYVEDQSLKNRNQKSKMQWSMLKQTISHMNNMERARADLYDRYLYRPESWTDGLTQIPENIFKKTKGGRYVYHVAATTDYGRVKGGQQSPTMPKATGRKSKSPSRDRDKKTVGKETKRSKPKV